jgi:hypothetical protein
LLQIILAAELRNVLTNIPLPNLSTHGRRISRMTQNVVIVFLHPLSAVFSYIASEPKVGLPLFRYSTAGSLQQTLEEGY